MQDGQLVAERNDLKLQFPRGCESDNQAMKEALKRMRVPLTLTGATPGSSDSFGCQLFGPYHPEAPIGSRCDASAVGAPTGWWFH